MKTRDQRLAHDVYAHVVQFEQTHPSHTAWKQYGSLAHALPILIRTAGLAQALAFVEARHAPSSPQRQLLQDLQAVLGQPQLVARSREAHFGAYLQLTQQTLAALLWFKRYAQSVLDVQAGDDAEEGGDARTE